MLDIINDFDIFCAYLEEKKPKLTRAREELGKKDCYAINALLSKPRELDGPKYLQPVYLTINLFFHIIMATGLFVREAKRNGEGYLVPSSKLERFRALNSYTKYMFLFRTYWRYLILMFRQQGRWLSGVRGKLPNSIRTMRMILSADSKKSA